MRERFNYKTQLIKHKGDLAVGCSFSFLLLVGCNSVNARRGSSLESVSVLRRTLVFVFSNDYDQNQCEIFNRICMCVFGEKLWQTV